MISKWKTETRIYCKCRVLEKHDISWYVNVHDLCREWNTREGVCCTLALCGDCRILNSVTEINFR